MTELDLFNRALDIVADYTITLASAVTVSSATAASPVVCTTSGAHGYSTGDLVLLRSFDEMTEVNGRVFKITVLTTTTFELDDEDGTGYTAEATGGQSLKLSTGRHVTKIFNAWPTVRADVLEDHSWNDAAGYSRLARLASSQAITAITQASPAVVTIAGHGYSQGDTVLIEAVVGMTELNGRYFTIGTVTTNTFQLSSEDSTNYTAYSSGGTAKKALQPLKPDHSFNYRYDLPADCLRVRNFAEVGSEASLWEVVGNELFTDEGITVPIRYTKLLKDPSLYGPKLFSAFAARLAEEIAPGLTDSVSREERAERRADKRMSRARQMDVMEQSHSPVAESSWLTERN